MHTRAATSAASLVFLLAACGGGGGGGVASLGDAEGADAATNTTLSEEEAQEALFDWAECMRDHGIDIADPQVGDGGGVRIQVGAPSDEDGGQPGGAVELGAGPEEFQAAREECGEPPSIGGEFSEEDRAEMHERGLAFAECMRSNGVDDFADPDFSDQGPGAGPRVGRSESDSSSGGAVIAGPFGTVDLGDPELEAAFEVCREELGDAAPGLGDFGDESDDES